MCFFLLAAKCPSMYLKWNKEIENLRHELPIKVRYNKPHVSLILLLVPPHWAKSFPTHRATPNMMIHSKSHWWVSERESSLFDDENNQRFIQKAEECREASDERFFGAKLRRSSCFGFALSRTAKKQHKKLLESSQLFFEGVSCDSDVTELNESLIQWIRVARTKLPPPPPTCYFVVAVRQTFLSRIFIFQYIILRWLCYSIWKRSTSRRKVPFFRASNSPQRGISGGFTDFYFYFASRKSLQQIFFSLIEQFSFRIFLLPLRLSSPVLSSSVPIIYLWKWKFHWELELPVCKYF